MNVFRGVALELGPPERERSRHEAFVVVVGGSGSDAGGENGETCIQRGRIVLWIVLCMSMSL